MFDMTCWLDRDKPTALPPGFTAHPCETPWQGALAAAAAGGNPGTLFHAPIGDRLEAALILTPDQPVSDATALQLATLAVRDALLAVVPPELPVTAGSAGTVALNGGEVARVTLARGPQGAGRIPDWLVLGVTIRLAFRLDAPGLSPWLTDLAEEGIDVSGADLLEGVCRHLLSLIDLWTAEGAAGIARAWRDAQASHPA
jgi:biotin-(acetyl-CoA carboxylase) ligase